MKTMRWMAAIGVAALALAGCGGNDDGDGTGQSQQSVCEESCGFLWECTPEGSRPDGDKTTYVLGCAIACELDVRSSCPDLDEAACRACFTGTCIMPDVGCLDCNCDTFGGLGND